MIRIIRAKPLAELRRAADLAAELDQAVERLDTMCREAARAEEEARGWQAEAEAEAARLRAGMDSLRASVYGRLAALQVAVSDPGTGRAFQAELALEVVRNMIQHAHDSGDPEAIRAFRVIDALLGTDPPASGDRTSTRPPACTTPAPKENHP